MKKDDKPVGIIQQLEQAEAAANSMAVLVGSYYHSLLDNKIPEELARDLTLDFQNVFLDAWRLK